MGQQPVDGRIGLRMALVGLAEDQLRNCYSIAWRANEKAGAGETRSASQIALYEVDQALRALDS